ncbi:MAG: hypothetical protein ACYC96_16575 [Fimbriimonadaceae bacterium]
MAVFVDCGDVQAASEYLAVTASSLSLAASSLGDPEAVWGSLLTERFSLRVTPFGGGRYVHIDFRPNRGAGAAGLLRALTRYPRTRPTTPATFHRG